SCIEQFWSTAKAKTINGEVQIYARVDGKEIVITESSVRRDLQLADKEDEALHKELGDSLVRAATTASSLELEHDGGNINKTQSKATPNEHSSYETDSARVEFSDEKFLGEDASKQGRRINAIDQDEDITLVNVQDNAEMFDVDDLGGEEVFGAEQEVVSTVATTEELTLAQALEALKSLKPKAKEIVIQEPMFDVDDLGGEEVFGAEQEVVSTVATTEELTLAQALEALKSLKPKAKEIVIQEQKEPELSDAEKATLFVQLLEKRRKHFAAKRAEEKRNKPPTQAQKKIMCNYLKNMKGYTLKQLKLKEFDEIQEMFDKAFRRVEDDKETTKLKQLIKIVPSKKEVAIDAIPLAVKSPRIVNWKINKEGKKSYYQIIRAGGKTQMYMVFSKMLESFDREDLEDLYKLLELVLRVNFNEKYTECLLLLVEVKTASTNVNVAEEVNTDVEVVTTAKMLIDTIVDAAQVTTAIADVPVSVAETMVTTALTITTESTKTNVEMKSFTKIQELFDNAMKRINTSVDFRTGLVEESTKQDKAKAAQESISKREGDELEQERSKK
nr:hypothetical protein [Tanacetum cinerariifolium]